MAISVFRRSEVQYIFQRFMHIKWRRQILCVVQKVCIRLWVCFLKPGRKGE